MSEAYPELMHFVPSEELRPLVEKALQAERSMLLELVPGADIQHNGGTAIPGALTKGDLDLQMRVERERMGYAVTALRPHYHENHPDLWTPDYALFQRYDDPVIPVGVVVTAIGSENDTFHLVRDLFMRSPELLEAYNDVKRQYEGRPESEYRRAKDEFFKRHEKFTSKYILNPNLASYPEDLYLLR